MCVSTYIWTGLVMAGNLILFIYIFFLIQLELAEPNKYNLLGSIAAAMQHFPSR